MTFLFRPMICRFVIFRHICQWYHGRLGEVNSIPWRVYSTSRTGSSDESLPIGLVGFKNPTETTAQWWLFQWNAWNLWKCLCFFLWKSMKFTKRHHGYMFGIYWRLFIIMKHFLVSSNFVDSIQRLKQKNSQKKLPWRLNGFRALGSMGVD